jgi:hypothetical protein
VFLMNGPGDEVGESSLTDRLIGSDEWARMEGEGGLTSGSGSGSDWDLL